MLELNDDVLRDDRGELRVDDIPVADVTCPVRLKPGASSMLQRLWLRALADVESNIVRAGDNCYFGAGATFGAMVYTRDIAYSGILGVNRTHPDIMRSSLRYTRKVRLALGLKSTPDYDLRKMGIACEIERLDHKAFKEKYHTNPYARRTDDVVWMWAYRDLLGDQPDPAEVAWMYDTALQCYEILYEPFFDPTDGLYFGQASFVDIHFPGHLASGYPHNWSILDCLRIKATCTNALHYRGLRVMQELAGLLGRDLEAEHWADRAESLRVSILEHLRSEDGSFTMYRHKDRTFEPRRFALGTALVVLTGVVAGDDAKSAIADYPETDVGIPLVDPLRDLDDNWYYHNGSAWPFVDGFFLWAKQMATGDDTTQQQAALCARACRGDGTFHEVVRLSDGDVRGSSSQLWSAAAFINACIRGGLVA